MRRFAMVTIAALASMFPGTTALAGPNADGVCGPSTSLFLLSDGASDLPATCTVDRGSAIVEGLYYQNASRAGGTALAAYPLFRVRAGIATRTEMLFDAPSQVAESGLEGAGLYPRSSPGFGLNTTFIETRRDAVTFHFEALPPVSRFAPSETQSRYLFGLTSLHRVSSRLTLDGLLGASTSRLSGFQNLFPSAAAGAAYDVAARTQIALDLGGRYLTHNTWPQAFGDLSVARMLGKNTALDVGLGTTFNLSAGSKAHYLAAGVSIKP